jgi:hypothetical protein
MLRLTDVVSLSISFGATNPTHRRHFRKHERGAFLIEQQLAKGSAVGA